MSSPESTLLDIIKSKKTSQESEIFGLFDQLKAVEPAFLLGEWSGDPVETGHQTSTWCADVNFAGKKFNSTSDVEPVFVYDKDGARVFYEPSGLAQLREIKYRDVVSTTLVYDKQPIFDYFRYIDEDTVIAAAENKAKPKGTFFFYLRRGSKKH